jgi:hypothetical protein
MIKSIKQLNASSLSHRPSSMEVSEAVPSKHRSKTIISNRQEPRIWSLLKTLRSEENMQPEAATRGNNKIKKDKVSALICFSRNIL